MNSNDMKFNKGQTLIEFVLVISFLMFTILGTVQFAVIYSIKMLVNYAAYTSCRVGIVNYNEDGTFNIQKIRLAALRSMSPIAGDKVDAFPGASEGENMSAYTERMKNARLALSIESPDENTLINMRRVCMRDKYPELTVRLTYWHKPAIPLIGKLFKSGKGTLEGVKGESPFIAITGEATMPVEIGPPFTPDSKGIFNVQSF